MTSRRDFLLATSAALQRPSKPWTLPSKRPYQTIDIIWVPMKDVAITESLWPMVWPSPRPVALSIITGTSTITLPVRPRKLADQTPNIPLIGDRQAQQAAAPRMPLAVPDAQGRVTYRPYGPRGWSASIRDGDPNSCVWKHQSAVTMKPGAEDVTIQSSSELTSTPEHFHLKESLNVTEGQKVIFDRQWENRIPRDGM